MEEIQDLAVMRPDQVNVPEEIQEAIRSLIRWAGDDPDREGLIDTPKRVLKGYAHRLQIQERLTAQVADCIWNNLRPRGVAVVISAVHSCMAARGVETPNVQTVTKTLRGIYSEDPEQAKMILNLMGV